MRAAVYVSPDYSSQAYYCLVFYGYIYKDDVYQTLMGGDNYCTSGYCVCGGDAYGEAFLPYDPNAEYTMEAEHEAHVYYRYVDESDYETGEYYDYYDFLEYTDGMLVYHPIYYDFTGNGPPRVSLGNILLGLTTAAFSAGAPAGQPHHLKVVSDSGQTLQTCGTIDRRIKFQAVDVNGRRTGTITTKERFYNASGGELSSISNSCRNEQIPPFPCSTDVGGSFIDRLWVGCPTVSGFCGTSQFISKWIWCPPGRPEKVLTSNTYHIRNTFVHVNAGTQLSPGTHLYP